MIIFTCPKCGCDLQQYTLAVYPPVYVTKCSNCGYKDERREEVIRVVYDENNEELLNNVGETEN